MSLKVVLSNSFKRDLKRMKKRGYDIKLLDSIVQMIAQQEKLAERYCDHALTGNYLGFRESHISVDWFLEYRIDNDDMTLILSRTGTHSDVFNE